MRDFARWCMFLLSLILLTACLPQDKSGIMDCSRINETKVESFPFEQITLQEALRWVQTHYGISADSIHVQDTVPGWQYITWVQASRQYKACCWGNGIERAAQFIEGRWEDIQPQIDDVLNCLGKPKLYTAYSRPNPDAGPWTYLELWYPEHGLVLSTFVERKLSQFDDNLRFKSEIFVKPGSEQEMIPRLTISTPSPEASRLILGSLRAWPGSVKDAVIDH